MNLPSHVDENEIVWRAIARTLWRSRKTIIVTTLFAALIAFSVSFWLLPRKYQADAYIYVGDPIVNFVQDLGLTISPTLPDIKAVVQLVSAPGLLESVAQDPAAIKAIGSEDLKFSKMADAIDRGKDQILLQVIDTDADRAALLANIWAEKTVALVNATYGMSAIAPSLNSQVAQSQQEYEQAQSALEDILSQNQSESLDAQLQRARADLKCMLDSISQTERVLDDLKSLEQELSKAPADSLVSLGDGLALTTLRQLSLTSQPCQLENQSQPSLSTDKNTNAIQNTQVTALVNAPSFSVQVDSSAFANVKVSDASSSVMQMKLVLQDQLTRLQNGQKQLEQEIPQLQKSLEHARGNLTLATVKRNQSSEIRDALLQQQQRIETVLAQSSNVAHISLRAMPAHDGISRNVVINTAAAGMLALVLISLWTLLFDWWRSNVKDQ